MGNKGDLPASPRFAMKSPVPRPPRSSLPSTEAGAWLLQLLLQLCTQSVKDVARIPLWPSTSVHALRKRMKKLQSLLRLVPPGAQPAALRELRDSIRELKGAVAAQRDADVLSALGLDLGGRTRPPRTAPVDPVPILRLAYALTRQVRALDVAALTWERVERRYQKTCRRAQQAWQVARHQPEGEPLHDWRKRVKDLYYQTLALQRWLRRPKRLRRTHQLGALLGHRLDLDLYRAQLKRTKKRPPPKLLAEVKVRQARLNQRIFRRAESVFDRAVPRLHPPARPRR
jgi:hypothetical protein